MVGLVMFELKINQLRPTLM